MLLPLVIRLKKIMDYRKDKFHMLGKRKMLEVRDQSQGLLFLWKEISHDFVFIRSP